MGAFTPVGHNVAQTWQSLINCVTGVGRISNFNADNLRYRLRPRSKITILKIILIIKK